MLTTGSFKIYMHTHIYYYIFQVLKENHVLLGIVVLKFLFCTIINGLFSNNGSHTFLMLKKPQKH